MYFNWLEEFYWIFRAMSTTGSSSKENRTQQGDRFHTQQWCLLDMWSPSLTTRWHSSRMWRGGFVGFESVLLPPLPRYPCLELSESCRWSHDFWCTLIPDKGVRDGRGEVTMLNPGRSQIIYVNYTNSMCACVCVCAPEREKEERECLGEWGKMYMCAPIHSKGKDRIGNQIHCNIFFYFVLFCFLSFGEADVEIKVFST